MLPESSVEAAFSDYENLDPWSTAEDEVLRSQCAVRGSGVSWSEIAEAIPGRSSHQRRDRWIDICAGTIDVVQQETIMSMIAQSEPSFQARPTERSSWSSSGSSNQDHAAPDAAPDRPDPPVTRISDGEHVQPGETNSEHQETQSEVPSKSRRTIDNCIDELISGSVPLTEPPPRLRVSDGDTWAFIKPPAREPEQSSEDYRRVVDRFSSPLRISSQVMKASESVLALKQLSSPTEQFKLIRRCKTSKDKMLAAGIKYVMNLTPPDEGEEAVELIGELSCPQGIVEWVRTSQQWRVSATLIGGHDEFTRPPGSTELQERANVRDYTSLRHCFAIERVLAVLHGQNPMLDSAPKVYTTVMTATKHLQIPAYSLAKLRDYVFTWATASPNSFINELHPEPMLKIADELQIEQLCQDTFAILVGEAALAQSIKNNSSWPEQRLSHSRNETMHFRQSSSLHEIWESRIQYARDNLVERLNKQFFNHIVYEDMNWVTDLPAVQYVLDQRPENISPAARTRWLQTLKKWIRGAIFHILVVDYQEIETPLQAMRNGESYERNMFRDVFNSLDYKDRVFTRTFWKILRAVDFSRLLSIKENIGTHPNKLHFTISDRYSAREKETQLLDCGVFEKVSTSELEVWSKDIENITRISRNWSTQGKAAQRFSPTEDTRRISFADQVQSPPKKARRSLDDGLSSVEEPAVRAVRAVPVAQALGRRSFFPDVNREGPEGLTSVQAAAARSKRSSDELEASLDELEAKLSEPGRLSREAQRRQTAPDASEDTLTEKDDPAAQASGFQQPGRDEAASLAVRSKFTLSQRSPPTLSTPAKVPGPWKTAKELTEARRQAYSKYVQQTDASGRRISAMPSAPTSTLLPASDEVSAEITQNSSDTSNKPLADWAQRKISEKHDSFTNAVVLSEVQRTPVASRANASVTAIYSDNWGGENSTENEDENGETDWIHNHPGLLDNCLKQAEDYLRHLTMVNLYKRRELELDTVDTFVSLEEAETKVLPLWAGGLDDGSGGVFNDEIPILPSEEDGFRPGRAGMHSADSEMSYDGLSSLGDSTANTSKLVNDGISVIADRRQVYAASEIESVMHAPQSVASSSTWEAVDTPAASVLGESDRDLPPEVEEAPDVSDTGSVRMTMAEVGIGAEAPDAFDYSMYESEDEFDENDFEDGENAVGEGGVEDEQEDIMETEYDFVEREEQRPGTATSEAPIADFAARQAGMSGQ